MQNNGMSNISCERLPSTVQTTWNSHDMTTTHRASLANHPSTLLNENVGICCDDPTCDRRVWNSGKPGWRILTKHESTGLAIVKHAANPDSARIHRFSQMYNEWDTQAMMPYLLFTDMQRGCTGNYFHRHLVARTRCGANPDTDSRKTAWRQF